MLDVVVLRPRLVARKPGWQRLRGLGPVDRRKNDQCGPHHNGEPDEKAASLFHAPESLRSPSVVRPYPAQKRNGAPSGAASFAESVSLSSTGSADLRLPPTAFGPGFDLLALRARRREESRRGHVPPQEVPRTKTTQFAEFQFSTFPQRRLQLVEMVSRRRRINSGRCLTCPGRPRSTTASCLSSGPSASAPTSTSGYSRSASRAARR